MSAALTGPDDTITETKPRRLRWAILWPITLILIVLNTGWIANSEMKTGVTEITIASLFLGVTFILFLVTLLNLLVRRWGGPEKALTQPELMMLYSLLSMSSVVAGVGHLGFFLPFLANLFFYASPNNDWQKLWDLLPSYIGPRDPAVLSGFYKGQSTFFEPATMLAWAFPLAVWSAFFLILLWTNFCLAAIVRRRWADEEHLPFPVIALPLEMTREGAPLYRNRLMWLGFAIPFVLHSLNSVASIIPGIPTYPVNSAKDLAGGLPFPWSALSPLFGGIHPAGVGFGFLINTDVLFSLWFFYFVRKGFNLLGVIAGWRDPSQGQFGDGAHQFPFTSYQCWGAWLALAVAMLWQGRSYYQGYLRRAWRGDPAGLDHREPLSARTAVFGFFGGYAAICGFVFLSGGSLWLPLLFLAIYFALMLSLARLEAETAVPSPFLAWIDPQTIISTVAGTTNLAKMDLAHLSTLTWFNTDYRAAAMPHQLQSFVGQDRAGAPMRGIVLPIMIAAAIAIAAGLLWDLQLYYVNGADTAKVNQWRIYEGSLPWNNLHEWLTSPKPPDGKAATGMLAGAGITALLSFLRNRFTGFPLSPAAYVLNTSWANDLFWLDMLIAWGIKTPLLRYGGIRMYRLAMPFFLGLILGDFVTGSAWSIVGTVMHLSLFRTFST